MSGTLKALIVLVVSLYYAACLCSLIYFRRDLENLPHPAILFLYLGQFVFPIAGFAVCLCDILNSFQFVQLHQ